MILKRKQHTNYFGSIIEGTFGWKTEGSNSVSLHIFKEVFCFKNVFNLAIQIQIMDQVFRLLVKHRFRVDFGFGSWWKSFINVLLFLNFLMVIINITNVGGRSFITKLLINEAEFIECSFTPSLPYLPLNVGPIEESCERTKGDDDANHAADNQVRSSNNAYYGKRRSCWQSKASNDQNDACSN